MTSLVKFSENFWGENGDQVIENHVLSGKKSIDALMIFLLERFRLEEHYSKELKKIVKRVEEITEIGSLGRAWDQIKEETNKMADLHQNLSQQLRAAVYSPIETFAKEQSKQRKQLIQEMKNAMREYTHLDAIITRAKMKYDKASRENFQEKQSDSKSSSNLSRLSSSKAAKNLKEVQQAEQEYQAAIQRMVSFRPQWEKTLTTVYDSLQMLEETRMEMVQHSLEKYVDAHKPIEKFIQESTNNCVEKLQKVNIDQDVQEWVASHKTGTSPPPMPQFIPWSENAPVTPTPPPTPPATPSASTVTSMPPPATTTTPSVSSTSTTVTTSSTSTSTSVPIATGIPLPGMDAALKELKELTSGDGKPMRKAKSSVSLGSSIQKPNPVVTSDANRNVEIDKKVLKHRDSGGNTPNSRTERSNSNATSLLTNPSPVKTSSSSQNVNSSTTTPTTKSPSQSNTSNHPRALSVPGSLKTTFKDTVIADYDYEGQDDNELSFKEGDKIFVIEKHESGWWLGQTSDGKIGLFPGNYTTPYPPE